MLDIAIVDDERLFANKLKNLIKEISRKLNFESKIDYYFNGLELLETFNKYNLIFLDIEMPIINGISINEKLNELKKENEIPYVAFVTSKDNLVFDALKSHPYLFIRKLDLYNDIFYCLKSIHQKINTQKQKITIHVGRNDIVINIDDIIYLEKNKNYVIYHTQRETYSVRSTIETELKKLEDYGFIRPHIGYVVNNEYIKSFSSGNVILQNDILIPNNKKYSCVREEYFKWLGEKYG